MRKPARRTPLLNCASRAKIAAALARVVVKPRTDRPAKSNRRTR